MQTICALRCDCNNLESRPAKESENATRAFQQKNHCVTDVLRMCCLNEVAFRSVKTMLSRRSQGESMKMLTRVAFSDSHFFIAFLFQRLISWTEILSML